MRGARGAVAATVLSGLLWGSSFVVIKLGLRTIDPYWFVTLRFGLAAAIALAFMACTGATRRLLGLLRSPAVLWLGVTNAIAFIFQFKGQSLTTAGKAALFVNSSTILVAIASRFVFRERLGGLKAMAVAVGMAGVLLVTTGGRFRVSPGPELRGDLLVLAGAAAWTFYILLDKKIVTESDVDLRALTAAMAVVTAIASVPAALVLGGPFPAPSGAWWAIAYTAVLCTIIPYFLWTWGLRYISATVSSVILLIEVVFAMALAATVLAERPAASTLVGGLCIVFAIVLASRGARAEIAAGPDVVPEQ